MSAHPVLQFVKAHWRDALEILILWVVVFQIWIRLQRARGTPVIAWGIVGAIGILFVSEWLSLPVLTWLLRNLAALSLLTLVVIFQPELRRAAIMLGSNRLFSLGEQNRETAEVLGEITFELANRGLGALLAIERDVPLDSLAEAGVPLDSQLSVELIVTIFHDKTPLHDGGLILRGNRILAGACIFPITQRVDLDRSLGLRHRAALGLSEETDAVILVVSEENSVVSICHDGVIERDFDPASFKERLRDILSLPGRDESNE